MQVLAVFNQTTTRSLTMSNPRHISIRGLLLSLVILATYLSLAKEYGLGRGLLCFLTIFQAFSSLLFFWTAFQAWKDENKRTMAASLLLGVIILIGSLLLAWIVFQPVVAPAEPFSSFSKLVSTDLRRLRFVPTA